MLDDNNKVPKKRGRKPKNQQPKESVIDSNIIKRTRGRPPKNKVSVGNQTMVAQNRSYSDDLRSVEKLISKLRNRNMEDVQFLSNVKSMLYKMYDLQSALDEQFTMVRENVFNEFSNAGIGYDEIHDNNQQFDKLNNSQQVDKIQSIYNERGIEFNQQDRTVFEGYNYSNCPSQNNSQEFTIIDTFNNSQPEFNDEFSFLEDDNIYF